MKRKINLIINGMFYGDSYTKRMLWSIFGVSVGLVGSLLAGIALTSFVCYGIAAALAIADAILIHSIEIDVATVESEEEESDETQPQKPQPAAEKPKKTNVQSPEHKPEKPSPHPKEQPAAEPESAKSEPDKEENGHDEIQDYTKKDINQLFHKYKVKKNHRPILIDESINYHIKQNPAYVWVQHGKLHILVIGKEPRKITVGAETASNIYYEPQIPANQAREYDCLEGTGLIPMVFSEYRPVYHSIHRHGHLEEVKNLYRICGDIKITAPSAREIMTLVQAEFVVQDATMASEDFNQYYKQVYKNKILLDDGVLNIKDYQTRIRAILQKLAEAPITPAAFRMTLTDMVANQLISNEYATFYTQHNRQFREKRNGV